MKATISQEELTEKNTVNEEPINENHGQSLSPVEGQSFAKRALKGIRNIRAEPIMGLFGLGFYLPAAFIQNLVIEKICMTKYSSETCLNKTNSTIEDETQALAAQYLLIHYLVRQLPAVVLSLFMGNWSDIYGRKFIIIASLVGNILSFVLYILNDYYYDWPVEYIIFAGIPAGLTGDYAAFMLGLFGFIKDISDVNDLSSRISTTDGIEMLSSQIGPLIGGQLFARYRYPAVFYIGMVFHVLAIILTYLLVHDKNFKKANFKTKIRDFLRIQGFLESLKSVVKKRSNNKRAYILGVLVTTTVIFFGYFGHSEIMFLYTRKKLEWEIVLYTYYNMTLGGCQTIGPLILMPLLIRFFKLSDITFGMIGHLGFLAFYLGTAFANDTLSMFLVCLFQIIATMSFVTLRSCISKCVSNSEIGKIMSMYAVLQALCRNLGQTIATQIYVATLKTYVGAFFVVAGGLFVINLAVYGWVFVDMKKRNFILEEQINEIPDKMEDTHIDLESTAIND